MLIVETIGRIRREHLIKGKSIKEIARDLKISRNTVRKVLRSGETSFSYEREIQPRPKLGRWKAEIDRMLTKNAEASARERLTLIRLFEELRALGYEGGYDAVRRYAKSWVREHASQTADAYVPLTFAPGEAYATPTSFAGANATALRYDAGSILDVDLDWAPWGGQRSGG